MEYKNEIKKVLLKPIAAYLHAIHYAPSMRDVQKTLPLY